MLTAGIFVFSKLDDFLTPITVSGKVTIIAGGNPTSAKVEAFKNSTFESSSKIGESTVDLAAGDNYGAWSMAISDFKGAEMLYFRVSGLDADGHSFVMTADSDAVPADDIHYEWDDFVVTGLAGVGFITAEEEANITLSGNYTMPLSKTAPIIADRSFTLTVNEGGVSVTVGASRSIKWYVDGVLKSSTANNITISAADYPVGVYYATAMVYKNGVPYSPDTEFRFRVTD
jgi:hypothetical protein